MWIFSSVPSPPPVSSTAQLSQSEDKNGVQLPCWTLVPLACAPVLMFQAPGTSSWWVGSRVPLATGEAVTSRASLFRTSNNENMGV